MELDPDDVFRDEDEDPENEFFQVLTLFSSGSFSQSKKKKEGNRNFRLLIECFFLSVRITGQRGFQRICSLSN